MCTHQPTFFYAHHAGLRRGVRSPMGAQLEVAKHARTDGDALVHGAIGGTVLPKRPASGWPVINDVLPFTTAKQAKKGGWPIRCACECKLCNQNSRFRTRKSHDFRAIVLWVRVALFVRLLLPVRGLRTIFA